MDIPSKPRGLSFTVSWGALEAPKSAHLSLGAALRILLLLTLCLGAFELGRRTERQVAKASAPGSAVVVVEAVGAAKPIGEAVANAAAGRPIAEKDEVITPLNVRDPSALVMGPTVSAPPAAEAAPPPVPPALEHPRARLYPPKDPKVQPDARF